jgi:peptide/nickel transport system permease protein
MAKRGRIIGILVFLGAIHAAVLAAGVLAPYGFAQQQRDYPYVPPMKVHFAGGRPVVFGIVGEPGGGYREDRGRQYPLRFFANGKLFGVQEPGVLFLLGSDGYGRDVFSRVLYGAQVSLLTGVLAAFLSLGIGWLLGTIAGFFGGWIDPLLMRTSEFFMALPWLYLLLGVRAFLPLHIGPLASFCLLIGIIGGVGWARPARLIRGVVLSARERGFVLAARGFGARPVYLIRRHVMPLTWGVLLTQATVLIPQYILAEVTLSFLGLGVGEPIPSWGNMLAEARQYHALVSHAWLLAPGLAAAPVLFGYLILADTLLDRQDS